MEKLNGKSGNMVNDFKKGYVGKKVFITGHTGFKGSWLLAILSLLKAEVRGYALTPNTENDLFCLMNGNNRCDSIIGDIRDKKKLSDAIISFQPDFIFHLAAQPLVRISYEIPSETFEVNAIGTANLLDSVRQLEKKCSIILITTDKVYYNNEWIFPYRENDRLGGYDPYSASKACAELVIESYRNSFFNTKDHVLHLKGIAVARAGNVIGGGDWSEDRLMPDVARAVGTNNDIVVRNPNAVRPWQHVLEPLFGYLLLGQKLSVNPTFFSQAYNFGPYSDDSLPVNKMVNMAITNWGKGNFKDSKTDGQPHEAGLLRLDISKAIAELNWMPRLNATQAVALTIDWYKKFYENKTEIVAFTEKQIKEFISNE
jgi:CDP-glucose 4,6-dehydratase